MKILMICDFFSEKYTYQDNLLAKYYSILGHDVTVLTTTFTDIHDYINNKNYKVNKARIYQWKKIRIIREKYKFNWLNKIKSLRNVYKTLIEVNPDILYIHGLTFIFNDCKKYKKINPKLKIIIDFHADLSNSASNIFSLNILHKFINRQYLNFYLELINVIFAVTPGTVDFLTNIYKVKESKIKLLPLGYDSLEVEKIEKKINIPEEKKILNIPSNNIVLITGGKINYKKKTDVLIDALHFLDKNVTLLIFGKIEEKYFATLQEKARNLNVIFLGWLSTEEITKYLLCSDIAVYPASQSVLWQQSIGTGLPMIVGNVGNQDASYLNRNNNVVVLKNLEINPNNLAEKIREIIENEELLIKMKEGAKKTAKDYLDYKTICKFSLTLDEEIIAN